MLSKLVKPYSGLLCRVCVPAGRHPVRKHMIPPTQYDTPLPRRLHLPYVMRVYWEINPLIFVTSFAVSMVFVAISWAIKNKVDVVYNLRNGKCISRSMDLRNPTVHKMIIINQKYEPWPEMQAVLDKMDIAEKRALAALRPCPEK